MRSTQTVRAEPERHLPPVHESWLPNEHSLFRPRHSARQRTALLCAAVFFFAPTVGYLVGVRPEAFENRPLHPFPAASEGWSAFERLSPWATDHLVFRKQAVGAFHGISRAAFGEEAPSSATVARESVGVPGVAERPDPVPHETSFPNVIVGSDDWLYLGEDARTKCHPTMDPAAVVAALRRIRAAAEASGREFVVLIAPDKSTAVPEFLPDTYAGRQCAGRAAERFWSRIVPAIGAVDLRDALAAARDQSRTRLYDAQDSHWTYLGGVTMTYALAERLRPGLTTTWHLTKTGVADWPADIPTLLGRSGTRKLDTYDLAPDGGADRTSYVASDFRTTLHLTQRGRPVEGTYERPTVLVADSFSQFASPFLAAGFRDMKIVHHESLAVANPAAIDALVEDRDVLAVELAERNVAGGASPLLVPDTVDMLVAALERHPR